MQIIMIVIKMLIGLIVIAAVLSIIYAVGKIIARACNLGKLDAGESLLLGLMCIITTALCAVLAYVTGGMIIH